MNHQLFERFSFFDSPIHYDLRKLRESIYSSRYLAHRDLSRKKGRACPKCSGVSPSLSFLCIAIRNRRQSPWTTGKRWTLAQNTIRKVRHGGLKKGKRESPLRHLRLLRRGRQEKLGNFSRPFSFLRLSLLVAASSSSSSVQTNSEEGRKVGGGGSSFLLRRLKTFLEEGRGGRTFGMGEEEREQGRKIANKTL